jgi:hypothetical protein
MRATSESGPAILSVPRLFEALYLRRNNKKASGSPEMIR